ncbi:MAG: two-component system response regulator, partial [Leptolyngbya sp. ERB_1_1]
RRISDAIMELARHRHLSHINLRHYPYMVKPVSFNNLAEIMNTLNVHWLRLNEKPQIVV